jgi:hypothetical protein
MAGRQRATFQKRQKEVKRLEKQRAKAEKRAARRMEKAQRPADQPFAPGTEQQILDQVEPPEQV